YVFNCNDCLVGESLKQCDLSLREGLSFGSAEGDRANRDTFSHQRNAKYCMEAPAPRVFAALRILARLTLRVSNMDCLSIDKRATCGRPANQRKGLDTNRAVMGEENEPFAVRLPNGSVIRLTQTGGGLYERIEYHLQVERRSTDDLEHIGGSGL